MNKKSWLIVGLSLAMAASIGVGISACGGKEPDTPPTPTDHTHTYDAWDYNETQHWKYCDEHGTDKSNIDETTREDHIFTNGTCECGMKEADVTPDEGLDTRVFYVVGSGAGDLSKCSFTELKSNFMLTKQPKKDENGYTVYTTSILTLYTGDTMKIVQDLDWDEGLGYFGVSNIKNNDGSLVDGGGPGNITPAVGKDGKYRFTVRTKPDITFSECTLEFEFIEAVEPLKNTAQIYIVGNLQYCDTKWPSGTDVTGCKKLDYDEATGEWSITLRLGRAPGEIGGDEFKLYNSVNGAYIPDGVNNNKQYGANNAGDYKISWKTGETDITFTKLEHTHVFDRQTKDDTQHWNICWLDDTADEQSREGHVYTDDQDSKCDTCGYTRHIHSFTKQNKDETQHWMECPADGTISPEGKIDHVYDQEGGKCVCGAEKADDCAHDGKIIFDYMGDTLPAGATAGGTITGKCEKCGNPIEVSYDKYVEFAASVPMSGDPLPPAVMENDKKYYGKITSTASSSYGGAYLGYKIEAAGTLTVTMDVVCSWQKNAAGTADFAIRYMAIVDTPLETGLKSSGIKDIISKSQWNTSSSKTEKVAKWKEQITFDTTLGEAFHSITLTFTEEDVGQNVYFLITTNINMILTNSAFLFETSFSPAAAAATVAPQEVAMLPEKKD